jgi:GTP-binding protein
MKKKLRAVKKAAGTTPLIVSAASGEGVPEVLRAIAAEVRELRGKVKDGAAAPKASARGWRP